MGIGILSTGGYVPEKVITNDDLSHTLDTSDEWIYSHTGIKRRHIAADNEFCSDLAVKAGKDALVKAGLDPLDLDMVIVATSTPDYFAFPNTASLVQNRLGAVNAGALDLSAACTGFIYALETARGMILGKTARYVLVIGSETFSRILDWEDRNTCVLFGDGAGAVLLGPVSNDSTDILKTILKADGSGAEALMVKAGGCRFPLDSADYTDRFVSMDGRRVYNFAVKANTELIQKLLDYEKLGPGDIKHIIPHQANIRIIQAAAKRLLLPDELFYNNMDEYANTSAASIPLALNAMVDKGLLARGDTIILLGFGAGLTYGGILLRW